MTPISQLQKLERNLRDAEERFVHAPGGLWLAASATLEALARIPPNVGLDSRVESLTTEARRLRADGSARASQHELTALTEWVELARQRSTLEAAFLEILEKAPQPIASRTELARAVESEQSTAELHAKDTQTLTPPSEALVTRLRAAYPEYDPSELPIEMMTARGKQALREVKRVSGKHWTARPFPTSTQILVLASLLTAGSMSLLAFVGRSGIKPFLIAALVACAFALIGVASMRRRSEVQLRVSVLEAWGFTVRQKQAREQSKTKLDAWITVARSLGQIDAFRMSDPGQSLDARENRLPALAPWIRTLVGGMDEDQARRFESEG